MTDDRLNDDIATQHKKELLWTDEDQLLAERAMRREDAFNARGEQRGAA